MKFRNHREMLDESMATVVEIPSTMEAIRKIINDNDWSEEREFIVKPYGYDERIGWNTHIVCLGKDGMRGVVGWTDSMPDDYPHCAVEDAPNNGP